MAPKSGKRGKKKAGLTKRRDQLLKEIGSLKSRKKKESHNKEAQKRNRLERLRRRATIPYHPKQKILLIGEGDFSFTLALQKYWDGLVPENTSYNGFLVATCLEKKEELYDKYPESAKENIKAIRKSRFKTSVLTRIDATSLELKREKLLEKFPVGDPDEIVPVTKDNDSEDDDDEESISEIDSSDKRKFDRIIFNFPHLGTGETDKQKSAALHRNFLVDVAISCHGFLLPKGELHITIKKGEPYRSWKLSSTVEATDLFKTRTAMPFFPSLYPGYQHRRTVGAAVKQEREGGPSPNADILKLGSHTLVFSPVSVNALKKSKK